MSYKKKNNKKLWIISVLYVIVLLLIVGTSFYFIQKERRAAAKLQEKYEVLQEKLEKQIEEQKKNQKLQNTAGEEQAEQEGEETEQKTEQETGQQESAENGVEGLGELRSQIEEALAVYEGQWSVYVYNLNTNEYLNINSHPMKAASLIKLYIMGAVYEKIEAGEIQQTEEINQLLRQMITVSDNESANELVRRMSPTGDDHAQGMEAVNTYVQQEGYTDTSQGRDLRDYREVPADGENYTSAKDCGNFLKSVYQMTCVSQQASTEMMNLLKQQQRRGKIPAGLPEGIQSANKTGELSDTENDAAVIFGQSGDYILCVMAQDLSDTALAQTNLRNISKFVYSYFNSEDGGNEE